LRGTHISERKFRGILRCYSLDITVTKTSELTGISRPTVNRIYKRLRERIKDINKGKNSSIKMLKKHKIDSTRTIKEFIFERMVTGFVHDPNMCGAYALYDYLRK